MFVRQRSAVHLWWAAETISIGQFARIVLLTKARAFAIVGKDLPGTVCWRLQDGREKGRDHDSAGLSGSHR